ncbi:MAG: hypothetical protein AUG48_10075 [Actinobacteria bacterium 13_1_20CM_3_68_9]|nr:MAG: hypothetical protein AUG48_10075 [Actinobacteria bacterium 13_1_20CM_3_68_9]
MIVCKQCGHHNEDNDTFCGSCGKFLEWSGERVVVAEPEPKPVVAPETEPEPAHLGLIDRVKHAVGLEEATAQPAAPAGIDGASEGTPAPATAAPPPAAAAPPPLIMRSVPLTSVTPPAPLPASVATAPAPEPVLAGVAAAPIAAGQADEPMSRRPSSIAPAAARPRATPRTMETPTRRHPGDLICGQCGEGNDPIRHFCRRCGNALDEALAVQLPWYRRLVNRLFGVRTRQAGWRPQRVGPPNVLGGVWRIVRLAIGAIIVVALLAFLLVPSFHNAVVDRASKAFTSLRIALRPNYDPVHPTAATATSAVGGHLPALAMDGFSNTYWAARASDRAPVLVLRFSGPVDIAAIGFRSGASGTAPADAFTSQPRPRTVHLVFSNGYTSDLSLIDQDATQPTQFTKLPDGKARQVTFVEIHVQSMYAPVGAPVSSVAISEVEFETKD